MSAITDPTPNPSPTSERGEGQTSPPTPLHFVARGENILDDLNGSELKSVTPCAEGIISRAECRRNGRADESTRRWCTARWRDQSSQPCVPERTGLKAIPVANG